MTREDGWLRGQIINRLSNAGFTIDPNHYKDDSPAVYVTWGADGDGDG